MEIKKYNRYFNDENLIEATGLYIEEKGMFGIKTRRYIFKILGKKGISAILLSIGELKKQKYQIVNHGPHPLLGEIAIELKNNSDFEETLIRFFVLILKHADKFQKNNFFELLKRYVPGEMWMTFVNDF